MALIRGTKSSKNQKVNNKVNAYHKFKVCESNLKIRFVTDQIQKLIRNRTSETTKPGTHWPGPALTYLAFTLHVEHENPYAFAQPCILGASKKKYTRASLRNATALFYLGGDIRID